MIPNLEIITQAAERISSYIHRTPVMSSQRINKLLNAEIYFKCENLQKVGAFKTRGAVNAIFSLKENELNNGVATHSSGNHAQALARAASLRGIKAHIVMPEDSSRVKIEAVKAYGGIVTLCESTLEAREKTLAVVLEKTNAIEIHPYNDYRIIAGQATVAKEFFEQTKKLDIIMAPVGGGGLLSGTALSTHYFSLETKVVAAEPEQANDAFRSFYSGSFVPSVNPNTIADGLRTSLGSKTFPIIQQHVHQIVTVSEKAIVEAMRLVWESTKLLIETSSAVPIAALLEKKLDVEGQKVGVVISGGNVDLDNLPW